MQFPGLLYIDDTGKRNHALDRRLVSRKAQRELAAGRVTYHQCPCWIKVVALRDLWQEARGPGNILKRPRPAPAFITGPAIFHIPSCQAFGREGGAKMSDMLEVILGAPKAAVDTHNDWKWRGTFRQTQFTKLIGIASIGEANIRWRSREGENVIGSHFVYRTFSGFQFLPGSSSYETIIESSAVVLWVT